MGPALRISAERHAGPDRPPKQQAPIYQTLTKAEVVRVLDEIGAPAVSLRTLFRSLARSQARDYRGQLSAAA
jgi:hypothetical protein